MQRQNLFADDPWDTKERSLETGLMHRTFWRPDNARMGATLWDLSPGGKGMRWHMHYGAEEMFFVLSGRPVFRTMEGEEELAPGDFVFCAEGRAGLHAFSNPHDEPARILAMSAGGYPDVVAYPEHGYAWVATRVPELPAGEDPGIIARFDFRPDRPDDRVS
jgi:mannose-6-phosphate isomerase-like protein (cupin superfamily)